MVLSTAPNKYFYLKGGLNAGSIISLVYKKIIAFETYFIIRLSTECMVTKFHHFLNNRNTSQNKEEMTFLTIVIEQQVTFVCDSLYCDSNIKSSLNWFLNLQWSEIIFAVVLVLKILGSIICIIILRFYYVNIIIISERMLAFI